MKNNFKTEKENNSKISDKLDFCIQRLNRASIKVYRNWADFKRNMKKSDNWIVLNHNVLRGQKIKNGKEFKK